MVLEKVLVVKRKMTDNAETIGSNPYFVGIAEVTVNVELFYLGVGSGMGRHGGISGFIGEIVIIKVMGFA